MQTRVRIVSAERLGAPTRLESLVRRVFGDADRPQGWFARKLRRERVDLRRSVVAINADATDIHDPRGWVGYVLVGTPPSLGLRLRTAGTGVVPSARGQGIGRRLLDAVVANAATGGYSHVQILSQHEVVPFYLHQGFELRRRLVTLMAFARGQSPTALKPGQPWALPCLGRQLVAWHPEAWEGTEPALRSTVAWPEDVAPPLRSWAHISGEGEARLVQRLIAAKGLDPAVVLDTLLDQLPVASPVLLPWLDADAALTHTLVQGQWAIIQRSALLEREVSG